MCGQICGASGADYGRERTAAAESIDRCDPNNDSTLEYVILGRRGVEPT
jgi:hypothetical protein